MAALIPKIMYKTDEPDDAAYKVIRKYFVYFAERNLDGAMSLLSDDTHFWIHGVREAHGQSAVRGLLMEVLFRTSIVEFYVDHILCDGDKCVVAGTIRFSDGRTVATSMIYTMSGTGKRLKIREIISYALVLNTDGM